MNWLTNVLKTYEKGTQYDSLLLEHNEIQVDNTRMLKEQEQFKQCIFDLEAENTLLYATIEELQQGEEDKLKKYWYDKYPKQKYYRWNNVNLPLYCTKNNLTVPKVTGKDIDTIAQNALKKVNSYMKYTSDEKENWQYADESVTRKLGDCEDGAILMYNIMVASGVPVWRIRLNAGLVQGGGHAYLTYLRESDNKWYIMDWCYWYTESVNYKKTWSEAKKYFDIWFSWNSEYIWIKPDMKV